MTIEQARKKIAREYRWAGTKAVDYLLQIGLKIAKARSDGRLSLNEMARKYLDHPYARRHGSIRLADKTIVNTHTGAFLRGWHVSKVSSDRDLGGAIINDTENADGLQNGTKFMLGRDIRGDISDRLEKHLPEAKRIFTKELERGNQ